MVFRMHARLLACLGLKTKKGGLAHMCNPLRMRLRCNVVDGRVGELAVLPLVPGPLAVPHSAWELVPV